MRVAMYYNNRDVRLEEMPEPRIGPGELLVEVAASGICGSDVMEWYRVKRAPLVLGHEIAGPIVERGDGADDRYQMGQRVFVSHHVPCNTCRACLAGHHTTCDTLRRTNFHPGGLAERVRIPRINVDRGVFPLPPELSWDDGVLLEPLACVVRGMDAVRFRADRTLLVLGSGVAGLLFIRLARSLGAVRVLATDVSDYRLEAARESGADAVARADADIAAFVRQQNEGRGADVVVVATGSAEAFRQAFRCVERGGTVLVFAPPRPGVEVSVPFEELWKESVTIRTSYAASPADIAVAVELLRSRRVSVADLITHRFGLAEAGRGFALVAAAGDSLKVVVEPQR